MLASICASRSQKPRKQYSRTVKRLFTGFQTNFQRLWRNMERKPLKSHATVVGGQATVGRLSINVFSTFQAIRNFFEKVAERSRDSGRRSRDCRPTVKQRFFDVSSNLENFEKSRWTVTRQWSEVTRPSADCQTTFFGRFKQLGKFWKKSLNGHATVVGGHATVGRLSNNVFWTFQAIWENFEKSRWTVTRQWSEVTRPSADCQTTFFGRFKQFGKILKSRWTVTRQWSEVTRPSADCQTTGRFKQLEIFEKSRWTVTRQWSEVTRPSDCQTTFFGRFKRFGKILKKVAERSRDSGWGHATVGRLSNNVFWTFQAENFEKSRWTVTRQWSEVTRPSADCQTTFLDVSSN